MNSPKGSRHINDVDETPESHVPPPKTPFPTTLADLQLTHHKDTDIYFTLSSLKQHTLSIPNRLTSILHDSHFITHLATQCKLPLIANERAGSWYIPPRLKRGSVYFKSTDGHHGQWAFSLRRLNLQLLRVLGEEGGAVVVDSTRRGKRFSDALSKTVPIWVGVMNRVLFGETEVRLPEWLGEGERIQIEERLEGWCRGFRGLGIDLEGLRKECRRPIRVTWVVNGESDGSMEREEGTNLLVCCSASRRVTGAEGSQGGYIQGAADDSEGWSRGLTATVFWEHKEKLMHASEDELPELIDMLLEEEKENVRRDVEAVLVKPTSNLFIGTGARSSEEGFDIVINCEGESGAARKNILDLKCQHGKHGPNSLRKRAGEAHGAVKDALAANPDSRILVTCSTGRDLSAGIALILLCAFFNDAGVSSIDKPHRFIDKDFVRSRLAWITSSKADANPSRTTLQAVHTFLMERPD